MCLKWILNKAAINPFIVRNGLLVSLGTPRDALITDSVYKNFFRLSVEIPLFAGVPGDCGGAGVCLYTQRALYKIVPEIGGEFK